jgi:hypothetical protein
MLKKQKAFLERLIINVFDCIFLSADKAIVRGEPDLIFFSLLALR